MVNFDTREAPNGQAADTWAWDGNDWTRIGTGPVEATRENHAMAYDPVNGEMLLFGGVQQAIHIIQA